jgi:hypothetical protein
MIATAFCLSLGGFASTAFAERVTEAAVEKACGDQIEGGCSGNQCATGCTKTEGGKLVDYGCTFPNKTGATAAVCTKIVIGRKVPTTPKSVVGATAPALKTD